MLLPRRAAACLLGLTAVLALAVPAAADDIVEIDTTLADAGFEEAFVDVIETEDGARVTVDYDASTTADQAAYTAQAREAAELVWTQLEVRVQAVDVQPSYGVDWLQGDLPATVSFTRRDLQTAFGPRPEELDEVTDAYAGTDEEFEEFEDDLALVGLGGVVVAVLVLLVFAGLVLAVVLLSRRPRQDPAPWGGAPAAGWGGTAPGGWGGAAAAPAPAATAPPAQVPAFDPADPWRSPPA